MKKNNSQKATSQEKEKLRVQKVNLRIKKLKEKDRTLYLKNIENEKKFNEKVKQIDYKIKVTNQDKGDCDLRIRDIEKRYRNKEITETYLNKKKEVFNAIKSKHQATIWKEEGKKKEAYDRMNVVSKNIQQARNEIQRTIKELERTI